MTFKAGDRVRHRVTGSEGVVAKVGAECCDVRYPDGATYVTLHSSLELIEAALPTLDEGDVAQLRLLLGEISEGLGDNAERFTCTEAEAIYEIYRTAGLEPDWFMRAHAHGDSELEGDLHEETDDEKGWTYR